MYEIYKKLTTIKSNKLQFKKYFKKSHFLYQKLIFYCLKINPSKKSRFFDHFRSHERSELPAHYSNNFSPLVINCNRVTFRINQYFIISSCNKKSSKNLKTKLFTFPVSKNSRQILYFHIIVKIDLRKNFPIFRLPKTLR